MYEEYKKYVTEHEKLPKGKADEWIIDAVLVESQSTWTYNIIIRALIYLVQTYHDYFKRTDIIGQYIIFSKVYNEQRKLYGATKKGDIRNHSYLQRQKCTERVS
uniref:hypothetical protein n=1 Tax=Agathobacter sp. TaxID=2021311 RepID=UPI0040571D02